MYQTKLVPQQFTLGVIGYVNNIQHVHSAIRLCVMPLCPCLCPDRSFGLVFWGQGLSEEQLEHSGWDVGDDFYYSHPVVFHLQEGYRYSGHVQCAEAAEDPQAATVSGSPRDTEIKRHTNTLRGQTI